MPLAVRKALSLLILGLSLITPALAQSQSVANTNPSSEASELAVALVRTKSEAEQEQLLTRKEELRNAALLNALQGLAEPLVKKGDYPEALRISHLALRVAHDVVHHGVHVLMLHRRQVDAPDVAVDADQRRKPGRQMQVGRLVLDGEGEELGDVHSL